jgi:uncharacterized integral membrane protein
MVNAIFIVILLAVLAFIGWAAKGFFTAAEVPLFVRILVGIVGAGGLTLLGVVIKDRIVQAKKEDFKEVDK